MDAVTDEELGLMLEWGAFDDPVHHSNNAKQLFDKDKNPHIIINSNGNSGNKRQQLPAPICSNGRRDTSPPRRKDEELLVNEEDWDDEDLVQALIASTILATPTEPQIASMDFDSAIGFYEEPDAMRSVIEENRKIREEQERDYQTAVAVDLQREKKVIVDTPTPPAPTPTTPTLMAQPNSLAGKSTLSTSSLTTSIESNTSPNITATSSEMTDSASLREARLRFFAQKVQESQTPLQHSDSESNTKQKQDTQQRKEESQEQTDQSSKPDEIGTPSFNKLERRKLKEASSEEDSESDSDSEDDEEVEEEAKQKCDQCRVLKSKKEFDFTFGSCRYNKHTCCALCTLKFEARCPGCLLNGMFNSTTKPIIGYEDEKQSDAEFMAKVMDQKLLVDDRAMAKYAKELQMLKDIEPSIEVAAAIDCLEACGGDIELAAQFLGI